MRQDKIGNRHRDFIMNGFSNDQIVIMDENSGEPKATGNSLLLNWNGEIQDLPDGWDDAILRSYANVQNNNHLNKLCALAVVINPKFRGKSLSKVVLSEIKGVANNNGIEHFIVPVRP